MFVCLLFLLFLFLSFHFLDGWKALEDAVSDARVGGRQFQGRVSLKGQGSRVSFKAQNGMLSLPSV